MITGRKVLHNFYYLGSEGNSDFDIKQANTDSSKMAEVIRVSDAQLRFVTNSQSGMGLLKCGNVVIPFDNQIIKETGLYKLYSTNLHGKIEMQKTGNQGESDDKNSRFCQNSG